jgi:hypothetical protein
MPGGCFEGGRCVGHFPVNEKRGIDNNCEQNLWSKYLENALKIIHSKFQYQKLNLSKYNIKCDTGFMYMQAQQKLLTCMIVREWGMSIEVFASVEICELSLDPEVATLFGREIGQSNGDVLLTGDEPARIKVG